MGRQKKDPFLHWAKFLNPESLKSNLIAASLFLAAYETLRASAIEQIRSFLTKRFNKDGRIIEDNDDYRVKVLSLDKHPLRASLLWLKENGAISEDDVRLADEIRKHRNELAHELQKFVMDADAEINVRLLKSIYALVTKIDRWWVLEFEIPTNPDFDGRQVDSDDIHSGNMLFLQMMIQIATGMDSSTYYEEFLKLTNRSHRTDTGLA